MRAGLDLSRALAAAEGGGGRAARDRAPAASAAEGTAAWVREPGGLVWHGRAMATDIRLWVADAPPRGDGSVLPTVLAMCRAAAVFSEVEAECTRFDPASPLMRLNAQPGRWQPVPDRLYLALAAACVAWRRTGGRFDPRVLTTLCRLGYGEALPANPDGASAPTAARRGARVAARPASPLATRPAFAPGVRPASRSAALTALRPATRLARAAAGGSGTSGGVASRGSGAPGGDAAALGVAPGMPFLERRPRRREVRLAGDPLDLGGIGKGLAVRWAGRALAGASASFLIDAGGDCLCRGSGPDGTGWRLGVEDPRGGQPPVAVLGLQDRAACTSSVRRRRWIGDGRPVHHLIDPRSGAPASGGLLSVTVVAGDPAWAEVWAKALFVEGAAGVASLAKARHLAALWVEEGGAVRFSGPMRPHVLWLRGAQTGEGEAEPASGVAAGWGV